MNGNESVISVRGLRKSYGTFEAVRGISFEVHAGEVFGLLGPNGAGKTTTVEILEGLRQRSSGETIVLGYDPGLQTRQIKDRIGVCLQATNLPDKIKVREALSLFATFYSRNGDIDKLLDRLQLADKRDEYYSKLSGGQKQRVALALALVNDPQLLFLDEPTTGLDPQVRLEIHGLIQELRSAKRSILLTTPLHRRGRAALRSRCDYRRGPDYRNRNSARDPAAHTGTKPDRNTVRAAHAGHRDGVFPEG